MLNESNQITKNTTLAHPNKESLIKIACPLSLSLISSFHTIPKFTLVHKFYYNFFILERECKERNVIYTTRIR